MRRVRGVSVILCCLLGVFTCQAANLTKCSGLKDLKQKKKQLPNRCWLENDHTSVFSTQLDTDFAEKALHKEFEGENSSRPLGSGYDEISFWWYDIGVLMHFNFVSLSDTVKTKLIAAGENIAFVGISSGEMLITTVPRKFDSGRSYYEAVFVTQRCSGPKLSRPDGVTVPCGITGSVQKIVVKHNQQSVRPPDDLCRRVEDSVSDYFYEVVHKAAKDGQ